MFCAERTKPDMSLLQLIKLFDMVYYFMLFFGYLELWRSIFACLLGEVSWLCGCMNDY